MSIKLTHKDNFVIIELDLDFKGILFIGDPHVSGKNIGRRKDNYLESVLNKLEQAAEIANKNNFITLILGDFFHRNDENNIKALNRTLKTLSLFDHAPWTLEGNHDKELDSLSEEDALSLFVQAKALNLLDSSKKLIFKINGNPVICHNFAYGSFISHTVDRFDCKTSFALTHHDLAFENPYPGSIELKEIFGCDFVVNGHMHGTKKSELKGSTWWHNPGNIEPLSVDLMHHVPRVWVWKGLQNNQALEPIELSYEKDVFDLTGVSVQAGDAQQAVAQLIQESSAFADALKGESTLEADKTEDASVLEQDLKDVLDAANASDETKTIFKLLFSKLNKD